MHREVLTPTTQRSRLSSIHGSLETMALGGRRQTPVVLFTFTSLLESTLSGSLSLMPTAIPDITVIILLSLPLSEPSTYLQRTVWASRPVGVWLSRFRTQAGPFKM